MLTEELLDLIEKIVNFKCEMQNIEVKKAARGTPERLYDTLSSFSNQDGGGIMVFGIDEKNAFEVTGVYDAQELQLKVTQAALQMEPVVRPIFTVAEYQEKIVVGAEIPECDINQKPCYYKGAGKVRGSYVRVGDADLPMTEYEIYSYEAYKKRIRDELRPVERATIDDFGESELNEYFIRLKAEKSQLSQMDKSRVLNLQGMTTSGVPTVAGLMLLSEYPQAFFPQLSITAMAVDGIQFGSVGEDGERFIDNQRIDGNIPRMLEESMRFVRRNIRNSTIVDKDGRRADRFEYPLVAVREVILNALIHRDYSVYSEDSPIRIILYKDRLEVENPGGLYGRLTINDLGTIPGDTRNPFLAGSLEILLETENRFSGIPTIYNAMKENGLKPPIFESKRGCFKVVLYNESIKKEEKEKSSDDGAANGIIGKIMKYCMQPRTKEEIANMLGIEATYYVVMKYIKPLVECGDLKMTEPEKPRSKFQKYYTKRREENI